MPPIIASQYNWLSIYNKNEIDEDVLIKFYVRDSILINREQ